MRKPLLAIGAVVLLSACAQVPETTIVSGSSSSHDINASTPAQRIESERGRRTDSVLTLEQMREVRATRSSTSGDTERLRAPALRDNALRYGAQGGLAHGSRQIQNALRDRATELGRIYDFNALLIRQPSLPGGILPPVIVESQEPMEQQDGGRTLRVADRFYEILQQARFVSAAPLWQTYLDMEQYTRFPEQPAEPLPRTEAEREMWRRFVTEGWNEGLEQAIEIFQANMRRLQRDFVGMTRYARLLEEGKVSAPVVADANLGTTGTGQNMRVDDRVFRITRDPRLNVSNPREWSPAIGGANVGQSSVPQGSGQPVPRTSEAVRGGRIQPTPASQPRAVNSMEMPPTNSSR
jgi:defect-in-organelle-trafficking protein DotC